MEDENTQANLEKEEVQETIPEASDKETKQEAEDLISKANEAAERIEKANKETDLLLQRKERLAVEATLSGKAEAGKKRMTKKEKGIAYTREFLKGTGHEDMPLS